MDTYPIAAIKAFEQLGPYTLRLEFDDGATQIIDFSPVLYGRNFGPLRDPALFSQVRIDPDFPTLVWPNNADFDPATLRYWPEYLPHLLEIVERWKHAPVPIQS